MDPLTVTIQSAELQELYLERKELLSDLLYLEDEIPFCQTLFNKAILEKIEKEYLPKMDMIRSTLMLILERLKLLKNRLKSQKHDLAKLLEGYPNEKRVSMFQDKQAIINEIFLLINAQKLIKLDLIALIKRQEFNKQPIVLPIELQEKLTYLRF